MPEKSQQTFIKITDGLLTGLTILLAGYISFRFIMLLSGPIFGITDSTTKLFYPVQFHVEEEGIAAISGQDLPVKLKRFGMFGVIIWVLFLLCHIVRSVGQGHPFDPENGKRLRWIGISIIGVTSSISFTIFC